MDFIIVLGLSGAGKSSALHTLEDINYYCVDNIPPALISTFYDLSKHSSDKKLKKIAVVTNVRDSADYKELSRSLERLRLDGARYRMLFLDSKDDVLITRYKQTRRKHPLLDACNGSTTEAVSLERELLRYIRQRSDYVIDSTFLNAAQLRERVQKLFLDSEEKGITIACMSFGFKYGILTEADLVFDVRCLPNPYYIDELRPKTGLDEPVRNYVMNSEESKELYKRIIDYVDYALPLYEKEGKSQITIGMGCTGGHHRSVTFAIMLYHHLEEKGYRTIIHHRDIRKV
ncbi:RNase adapter RapZ [Oscillospiraceae bacterium LCP25S3_E10]|nr:RNase adapter RapZ [Ruminococcus sp.]MDD6447951.1 RNase adapter RapZ [Ruminococcus sp.]MDY2855496.1 RNase adapter RapZ [Oscillospiraceae bacterium]